MVRTVDGRPYWPSMLPHDFDASLPVTLDVPTVSAPLSDGADLLAPLAVQS